MSDIVSRLRSLNLWAQDDWMDTVAQAAAEITRLQKELETAREALEPFADVAEFILAEAPAEATMWQAFVSCDGSTAQISLGYLRRAQEVYRALKDKEVAG